MAWPEELLALVDEAAGRQGMNRSEFVRYCVTTVLAMGRIEGIPVADEPAVMAVASTRTVR
jgi:metal-responsive CopG/Arc/MetJ family transcriptional regulator